MNPRNLNPETQLGRAFTCGILQLVSGWTMLLMAILKAWTAHAPHLFNSLGITEFIAAALSLFAGGFGVYYGRTGNKCTTVTSMVFSILTTVMSFGGLVGNSAMLKESQSWLDAYLDNRDFQHVAGCLAVFCHLTLILVYILDFVVSIVQAGVACSLVCSCCKPANTNAYTVQAPYAGLNAEQPQVHAFGDGFQNP